MDSNDQHNSGYALAFETSGAIGSIAIGRGGDVLEQRRFSAPMRHALEFVPAIEALCRTFDVRPADIDTVHVSIGPGSFTGLRIGVTAARTLALAAARSGQAAIRCTAVPTLEVIAQNALRVAEPSGHVAVLLDAKRARTYASLFELDDDIFAPLTEPEEVDPVEFLERCPGDTVILGDGARVYQQAIEVTGRVTLPESLFAPRAETTFLLGSQRADRGQLVDPRELVPAYIRPPEAEERWARRNQSG